MPFPERAISEVNKNNPDALMKCHRCELGNRSARTCGEPPQKIHCLWRCSMKIRKMFLGLVVVGFVGVLMVGTVQALDFEDWSQVWFKLQVKQNVNGKMGKLVTLFLRAILHFLSIKTNSVSTLSSKAAPNCLQLVRLPCALSTVQLGAANRARMAAVSG